MNSTSTCDSPLPPVPSTPQDQPTIYFPPWIYPPAEFDPVDQVAYVGIPAIGTSAIVVSLTVSRGKNGIIQTYANDYVGGGFQEGQGNIFWQILRNGQPIKFYNQILASLGSTASPTRHPSGFRVFENDLIQLSITNVAIVVAGQLIGGRFAGWLYPKKFENPQIWV